MKVTVTYKTCQQISPDDYQNYTKVVHLNSENTLRETYEKITADWKNTSDVDLDVELHFNWHRR